MKPWKRTIQASLGHRSSGLQWGHGDEAVEECCTQATSMLVCTQLQWGHGDEAVKEGLR